MNQLTGLKNQASIPVEVLDKVEMNLGSSYSSRARLELEIGLSKDENKLYLSGDS